MVRLRAGEKRGREEARLWTQVLSSTMPVGSLFAMRMDGKSITSIIWRTTFVSIALRVWCCWLRDKDHC